ncbi:MAG: cupin domain-containing protein [Deltaproteobacteria bacterium]|nr:cupin domain-containing protein [Deltaproteobacteria bacterium]
MAEIEREREALREQETAAEHYYDYEARFVKQKREKERINFLPRVIKPAMFAPGEFALGDIHINARYTVAPLSSLTCGFVELCALEKNPPKRAIHSELVYIIDGSGESIQDGKVIPFHAGDAVIVPAYTMHHFMTIAVDGFRAWLPQVRLWHNQGLLWREQQSEEKIPLQAQKDRKLEEIFQARRQVQTIRPEKSRYDWFLNRLAEENQLEQNGPRVLSGRDGKWELTRQGRLKFLISRWTEVANHSLDLMEQEIAPGERSGEHRHIFEELLLVLRGRGHDLHEGTRHSWQAGDLICIPPMIAHQHVNDGDEMARLVSVWARQPGHEFLGGIEQLSDASDWQK